MKSMASMPEKIGHLITHKIHMMDENFDDGM